MTPEQKRLKEYLDTLSEEQFRELQREIGYYGNRETLLADFIDLGTDFLDSLGLKPVARVSHALSDIVDDWFGF